MTTALRDAIDYTTLGWVKPELDETLRLARVEIEAFAEDPTDSSRMRFCVSYLHQVQGTLRMVELYAPAMVAEEMEQLAQSLLDGAVPERDEACATLMRGVVLLPDYLERLQSGHKDIPIVLLPLLNELRAVRGEKGLSESVLFVPDLQRPLPDTVPAESAAPAHDREATAAPLLAQLQDAMADWPEQGAPKSAAKLARAFEDLMALAGEEAGRRMLWVASCVAAAVGEDALPPTPALRQAFASVEREARRLFEDHGFGMPTANAAQEPTRQLLYHVAYADAQHPALQGLRDTFDLDMAGPSESELAHAKGSLSGRNRALLDTVSAALKEDLLRIKDALDLHLRSGDADVSGLQPQVEALGRVADTLGMLGLGVARTVVQQQRDAMESIVLGDRAADEGALLDIAGALLYVDASLDDQVARIGGDDEAAGEDLLASESRKILEVLAREAIANFADARQAFVAFVETNWDHDELVEVPRLLQEVAGALNMLELPLPAGYLVGVRLFAERELIARRRVPNGRQLDTLADALASLEYYLEALSEQRPNRDDILDITRNGLESLGYWPLPDETSMAAAAMMADDEDAGAPEDARTIVDEVVAPAPAPVETPTQAQAASASVAAAAGAGAKSGGFEVAGDEIDDEIREVFLEEFEEEIDNLDRMLPPWRADFENLEQLRPIRRVFHTLKGSGRLVGARVLGEFAWKTENMLNRVLDNSRAVSPAVVAMVDQAFYTLPQLHAALRGVGSIDADLEGIQAVADRISAGEEVFYSAPATAEDAATAVSGEAGFAETKSNQTRMDDDGEPCTVDPVLLEILDAEVGGHLATVEQWLETACHAPTRANDALLRAIHTMNGAFAMTEVPSITEALTPAEAYVKRLLAAAADAAPEGVEALAALAVKAHATITALNGPSPRVPRCTALAARLEALRDSLPEATLRLDEVIATAPANPFADTQDVHGELGAVDLTPYTELVDAPADGDAVAAATHVEGMDAEADRIDAERVDAERIEAERVETGRAEAERVDAERVDAERVDAERVEAERVEAERIEAERVEAERAETDRAEAERAETERIEAERIEAERVETERVEAKRAEAERVEAERAEAERAETDRAEAERAEAERIEAERIEAERAEAERGEAERAETGRAEAERVEAERAEVDRAEAERAETDRAEAERTEAKRAEAERAETERIEAERTEAERLEAERVEAERVEAERVEAERVEAERVEAERVEAERVEAERVEAERVEAEGVEAARVEAERVEAERVEAERVEAERVEAARVKAERVEADRIEAERTEAERIKAERVAVERVEAERIAAEKAEAKRIAAEQLEQATRSSEDPDAALDLTDLDPELVDIFVEEGVDLLDHSDGLLAQLRAEPGERELLIGLQRDLHTLKGGARMAGIMAVGELGHVMESLLEAVVDQRTDLGADGVPLLERGIDRLHAMVTRVGARHAIGMPDALIAEFDRRARAASFAEPEVEADAVEVDASEVVAPVARIELKPLSAPISDNPFDDDDDISVRAPQEQVRIRADLLDRLVNYAGEVAIYRSRLEQQLGAFRGAMGEMEQTNFRLRDQLRRLDAETEAQIIARYQRENENEDQTFDPLELDRFSTLQQLSRGLAESANDLVSLQGSMDDLTRQYETLLLQQSRVSSDLQEGLMRTRMVPFDTLVPRLRRVLRQAATDTGKPVQLKLQGAQGELDRNVLERMTAPLEHMLRNAVAHGLETAEARKKAKKPAEGEVRVMVRREGSEVVLEVGDDGAGLDRNAIRARAIERGLIREDAELVDSALDALIFEPGFSTVAEVSRLAGRGVGMDVVASEVRQLGGTLDIHTTAGKGTNFVLRLPQTLAVTQAVFVRIGETDFAVPIASVSGVGRISREDLEKQDATYAYGGDEYSLHDLGRLLGQAPAKAEGHLQMPLLLIRSGDLRAAVAIDQVVGNREIVVKPVGPQVASLPGIFGATVMGDGSVVVILDVAPLVRRRAAMPAEIAPAPVVEARKVPLVMVVDDSITMRKVTGRVLERNNFEVDTAKDGIDALEHMAERIPDLMLLDIEMPRMDGYELATAMRADPRMRDVPIIMITSRTGEKHRQRAFEIGVQRYLGKPYQEHELLRNVFELLELEQADSQQADSQRTRSQLTSWQQPSPEPPGDG